MIEKYFRLFEMYLLFPLFGNTNLSPLCNHQPPSFKKPNLYLLSFVKREGAHFQWVDKRKLFKLFKAYKTSKLCKLSKLCKKFEQLFTIRNLLITFDIFSLTDNSKRWYKCMLTIKYSIMYQLIY